jgi:hypothetical protein
MGSGEKVSSSPGTRLVSGEETGDLYNMNLTHLPFNRLYSIECLIFCPSFGSFSGTKVPVVRNRTSGSVCGYTLYLEYLEVELGNWM